MGGATAPPKGQPLQMVLPRHIGILYMYICASYLDLQKVSCHPDLNPTAGPPF